MKFYIVEDKQVLKKPTLTSEGLEEITAQELLIKLLGICKQKKFLRPNYDGYFSKLELGDVAYLGENCNYRKKNNQIRCYGELRTKLFLILLKTFKIWKAELLIRASYQRLHL